MIVQGSNIPIRIEFDINERPTTGEVSVSLQIPGQEIAHWYAEDLIINQDGTVVEAPITQEESMHWEVGKCKIEVKWVDGYGNTMFAFLYDKIVPWEDKTVLEVSR